MQCSGSSVSTIPAPTTLLIICEGRQKYMEIRYCVPFLDLHFYSTFPDVTFQNTSVIKYFFFFNVGKIFYEHRAEVSEKAATETDSSWRLCYLLQGR